MGNTLDEEKEGEMRIKIRMDSYNQRNEAVAAFTQSGYLARHVVEDGKFPLDSRGFVEAIIPDDMCDVSRGVKE